MIKITSKIALAESELHFTFIRAAGPGGQNVNKVATAVQLRFNLAQSTSLPEAVRQRLMQLSGNKVSKEGNIIIKANRYRTQESNKQDAIERLQVMIQQATIIPKKRKKTKPTLSSIRRRLTSKKVQSRKKSQRSAKDFLE